MSKSSKKAKARKTREKRELEQERLDAGDTTAHRTEQQKEARAQARSRGRASNAYAGVAGMGAATVGQLRLYRLMNLFTIMGVLTFAAALGLAVCAPSDSWSQAVLSFLGYGAVDDGIASPRVLLTAEFFFTVIVAVLCLFTARWGKAWLRGDGTYRRFISIIEICGGLSIGWLVVCLFWTRIVEPVSGIITVVFVVTMATIMRLHRERGL